MPRYSCYRSLGWSKPTRGVRRAKTCIQLPCTIRSHGTRSHILRRKLHSGTFKTKVVQGRLVRVAMVWKSHCATSVPACVIFYHVTASCKEPILTWLDRSSSVSGGLGKSGRRHSVSLCMSRVRPSKSRSNDYSSICPLSTMWSLHQAYDKNYASLGHSNNQQLSWKTCTDDCLKSFPNSSIIHRGKSKKITTDTRPQ